MQHSYRYVASLIVCVSAIIMSPAIARAECGRAEMKAVFAPHTLSLEAVHLTPKNTTPLAGSMIQMAPYLNDINAVPRAPECADDSFAVRDAVGIMQALWSAALRIRAYDADTHFVATAQSQTHEAPACAALYRKAVRYITVQQWWYYTTFRKPSDPALPATLPKMPYAQHVFALWRALAKQQSVALPPLGSNDNASITKYRIAVDAARDHMPDNIKCPQAFWI